MPRAMGTLLLYCSATGFADTVVTGLWGMEGKAWTDAVGIGIMALSGWGWTMWNRELAFEMMDIHPLLVRRSLPSPSTESTPVCGGLP